MASSATDDALKEISGFLRERGIAEDIIVNFEEERRILTHRGLRRRHNPSDINAVLQAVETVVTESLVILECVRGGPNIVRADNGTENVNMAAIQCFFRREAANAFAD
ncbi:hypothetical protein pdam_00011901 [Pocillopora damicornis]|uniref:Uncharacterized protein n=1 Tax=Pocillopora damicornis TaxID=46731 RepID=A0A3M6V1A0_POCDA|nr:hypothetical protein pdam_00011901 [Pocillopora damicornis]